MHGRNRGEIAMEEAAPLNAPYRYATAWENFPSSTSSRRNSSDRPGAGAPHPMIVASKAGDVQEIRNFVARTPDVWTQLLNIKDNDGLTCLHIAVVAGYDEVVSALLSSSAGSPEPEFACFNFLHARTVKGFTAVHLAVISENAKHLELLICKYKKIENQPDGSQWDFTDRHWMTPLHYAVLGNRQALITQLLEWRSYDRHVNARDYFQRTPLHLASCHRPVSVEAFLEHPTVDVNAKDCLSLTPLHWAVYFGRVDVVQCLTQPQSMSFGKMIDAVERDIEGRSVLEIAMEDALLDLNPAVSENFPPEPFQQDELYSEEETATIHYKSNAEIVKLLLRCPEVKEESQGLNQELGVNLNTTINTILFVAALVATASIGLIDDWSDVSGSNFLYAFVFFKLLAIYGSVATLLAGATILLPLGRSTPIVKRVKYAQSSSRRLSWMLGVSLWGFLAAFYTENAMHVEHGGAASKVRIPYHVVSVVAIISCISLLLYFLRLHEHVRNAMTKIEIDMDSIKIWWEYILVEVFLSFLFYLERQRLVGPKVANWILDGHVKSHRRSRRRRQIRLEAEKLCRGYFKTKGFKSPRLEWDSEFSFRSDIEERIVSAYGAAWNSTTRRRNLGMGETERQRKQGVEEDKGPDFAGSYWGRQGVSTQDEAKFRSIQREVREVERAYSRLTMKDKTGRPAVSFLDRLPRGIIFWIDDWVKLWKSKFPIFYRGYVFDRDLKIFAKISKQISSDQTRFRAVERGSHTHEVVRGSFVLVVQ